MATEHVPLLAHAAGQTVVDGETPITREQFIADVAAVARALPAHAYVINLCEDRRLFMVAFCAALLRGQVNLLPPSRAPRVVADIATEYPDSHSLTDRDIAPHAGAAPLPAAEVPAIPGDQIAAIVFTSGSTGRAQPNVKSWSALVAGARLARQRFGLDDGRGHTVVATVPPQHMFGLETSVMLPLAGGLAVWGGRPFFPADVAAALAAATAPRLLVTTPVHLRACLEETLEWPEVEFLLSATAPLPAALAERAEQLFAAPVMEIFGSSETGAMATRRTVEGERWQLLDGMALTEEPEGVFVSAGHLPQRVPLNDRVRLSPPDGFTLLGRHSDMINIAGKRASLGDLNRRLLQIAGVVDAAFVQLDDTGEGVVRLAALVVAPGVTEAAILAALREAVDPVFLPRPLYKVDRLPRNEVGKLPRDEVLGLLRRMGEAS